MSAPQYPALPSPSAVPLSPRRFPDAPPARVIRALLWLRGAATRLARALGPAELSVFEQTMAGLVLHALGALVRAGVPEALARAPLGAQELAERTGTNPDALFRTLRCVSLYGYFRLRADGRFEHNARSRVLAGGRLRRTRELLLYFTSGSNLAAWSAFDHALGTGRSPFDHVHGKDVWQWFEEHADEQEMFAHAMMGVSVADAPVVARLYPFGEVRTLCDVGGGRGTLLSELLIRHGHLRGTLYESPGVLESARELLAARGVLQRVSLVPGSFFDGVPAGADAYLLKNVLHDWDDERCARILRNVREAASSGARVLIAESIVEPRSRHPLAVPVDLQMMVVCSEGRERSRAELLGLLEKTGFRGGRVFTHPVLSVVEGVAV